MPRPLVSVISVNYNQAAVTCEMVASLRNVTYPHLEVIVVDNASPTDDPSLIKELYPEVKLIRSTENLGFAGGNNVGIAHAQGQYVLFLNNDTEVDPGFLEPLVNQLEQDEKVGIVSPKIIYHGTQGLIQFAGSKGINPWTGRSITIGQLETDQGQYDATTNSILADGAAMMVPMRVIKEVGLMPELFFLYYEELDWCEMIKRAGYTCQYVGQSTVYHKESVSVGKASLLKTYYMNRNRLLFLRRNISGWPLWTSILIFLLAALPKKALEFSLRAEWKHLKALGRGLWWNLTHKATDAGGGARALSQKSVESIGFPALK
ncbi:glycosyltransferase family 2 protein [Rufibacter glacialis]|uniref:Glycosyltransferase family 2 protein n=1 Tax=Rufibacter glacialis TaxID=1259555 RepID=A0A5M8QR90_9BACT|nr:glycosyltransferase family 2 protein [Rufibacter glacialis]KAA6437741.1 glycosyltransferase family 2 protein [Rufibacter glacialis]GGK56691.1 glycosyl transferase [Rufibacter glacialis]